MDRISPAQRSQLMSRIRGTNTALELAVYGILRSAKLKFSRHVKNLPGKPDAVMKQESLAIFVDGDFWHGWLFPKWRSKLPIYWQDKINENRRRDRRNIARLRRMGWKVVRIWEHEVDRSRDIVLKKIFGAIADNKSKSRI